MNQFFNLRNRVLQIVILGLVALTFYTYYRTTIDKETHPTAAAHINNGSPMPEAESSVGEVPIRSPGNSSLERSQMEAMFRRKNSSISVVPASNWTGPQLSLQTGSTSSNETSSSSGNLTTTISTSSTSTGSVSPHGMDTARAIYRSGHDVPAADKCPDKGRDKDLVIVIMSAPGHAEARTAIRETWGHFGQRRDVAVLFMVGLTRGGKIEESLRKEERLYGDVIRGRFVDSYSNLTLKTISSLEWVCNYCSEAKFVLKTDDDMFINVPRLLGFVHKHENEKNVIFGRLAQKWKPIRNNKSKYYVSSAQYKPAVFPDFTTGPAYLLSRDVVKKLYDGSLDQTYLKLEDVFTTGIVAHKLGIRRTNAREFFNKRIAHNACNVQRGISIHMVKYSEQFDLWKKLLDGKTKCK